MDPQTLRSLIDQGKGPTLDWHPKTVSAEKLAASLVALANTQGGTVLVGLTPKAGRLHGLKDPQDSLDTALKAALSVDPPLIIPLPRLVDVEGQPLLVINVPPGLPHVYALSGRYLVRKGSHNRPLTPRDLRRLMMARGQINWEAQIPEGAGPDDLNWEAVSEYAEGLEKQGQLSPQALLINRGCLVGQGEELAPTYAGLLLFGREPGRWVKGAQIEAARFAGLEMGDAFVRQTIEGPLPAQLRQAEAFLKDYTRKVVRMGAGMTREEQPEYPPAAAREAIVNAVAHRDYSISGDQIRLFMFSDRLEVTSPGKLPGPVTVDNIVKERFSRNEIIVQVLADLGFIERLGYGIDRMIRLMQKSDLPAPQFQETAGGFQVTLFGPSEGPSEAVEGPNLSPYTHLRLNERQEKALAFLLTNHRITNRDYQTLCPEVHPETLRRDLADLVSRDVLLKIGQKRATYYILKK